MARFACVVGLPERLAGRVVAVPVEVFDPVPHATLVDVADDLLDLHASPELHLHTAFGAQCAVARLDVADDGSAGPPLCRHGGLIGNRAGDVSLFFAQVSVSAVQPACGANE